MHPAEQRHICFEPLQESRSTGSSLPDLSGELPPQRAPLHGCGVRLHGAAGQRREHDADGFAGRVAEQSVPVEPVCPKVWSEHPGLPDSRPTPKPNPRGANPAGLWFLTISRAVSGRIT